MNVFVSPHFDDAVGSCGCQISSISSSGQGAEVLTVFAGQHGCTVSGFAKWMIDNWHLKNGVTERIQENDNACRILGAQVRNLSFPEALYRKDRLWLYPDGRALFGTVHEKDLHLPEEIAEVIAEHYSKNDVFYFPGAIGGHVDHIIVKRAGEILAAKGCKVWLYEDFSYSGQIQSSLPLRMERRLFAPGDIEKKIRAVQAYTSQLEMLFQTSDPADYFYKTNRTESGGISEVYYEICSENRPRYG